MSNEPGDLQLLTVTDVAARLHVSATTVQAYIKARLAHADAPYRSQPAGPPLGGRGTHRVVAEIGHRHRRLMRQYPRARARAGARVEAAMPIGRRAYRQARASGRCPAGAQHAPRGGAARLIVGGRALTKRYRDPPLDGRGSAPA